MPAPYGTLILAKKHSHSGECPKICPQDVFQTVGSGICPAVRDVCGSCTLRPQTLFRPVHSVQNCTWLLLFSSCMMYSVNIQADLTMQTGLSYLFHRPFAHTNYFYNSYALRTIPTWNILSTTLVTNPSISHINQVYGRIFYISNCCVCVHCIWHKHFITVPSEKKKTFK